MTLRHRCHLVVNTLIDSNIIEIEFDSDFIEAMLGELDVFYENHFRPALLVQFFYKHYDQYSFVYGLEVFYLCVLCVCVCCIVP